MSAEGLKAAEQKMRDAGHSDEAIRTFSSAYERLEAGESGMMPTADSLSRPPTCPRSRSCRRAIRPARWSSSR